MKKDLAGYRGFAGLIIVYLILIFLLPANPITKALYHLSDGGYRTLYFLMQLPIIAAWSVAYYSYYSLRRYADQIADTPEGADYRLMVSGLRWLVWGAPLTGLLGLILRSIAVGSPGFINTVLIIINYSNLLFTLVALNYLSSGSRMLALRAKMIIDSRAMKRLMLIFVTLGVIFCFAISHLLNHNLSDAHNPFHLPGWLVIVSLVIPYLFAWLIGLLAAYELFMTSRKIGGLVYRKAVYLVANGLVATIIAASGLQYYRSLVPRTGYIALNSTLIIVYGAYALSVLGSVLIINGAKQLIKIEEV